jgi:hypothetical protein
LIAPGLLERVLPRVSRDGFVAEDVSFGELEAGLVKTD